MVHDFLFTDEGNLHTIATYMPALREELASLPKTCARWRPANRVDDLCPSPMREVHMEFVGTWRVPERLHPDQGRVYVNPDAPDADRYAEDVDSRIAVIERLLRLGWPTERIGTRLGMTRAPIGKTVNEYGLHVEDIRETFRQNAAETYVRLVEDHDVLASTVASIYGRPPQTMVTWARQHTDYDPMPVEERVERSKRALADGGPERIRGGADD